MLDKSRRFLNVECDKRNYSKTSFLCQQKCEHAQENKLKSSIIELLCTNKLQISKTQDKKFAKQKIWKLFFINCFIVVVWQDI